MKQISINQLLKKPTTILEKFNQQTKIAILNVKKTKLPYKKWHGSWKRIYFKSYPRLKEVILPKPVMNSHFSLTTSLKQRCSRRDFHKVKISKEKLSTLLFYGSGLRYYKDENESRRFYPSAGGRYPLETYVISLNTELDKGVYHYNLKRHVLETIKSLNKFEHQRYFDQRFIPQSSFIILLTAVFKRSVIKYGDRSYRYILIETGHLAQNLYLLSTILKLKCCAIGSFIDDKINSLLDINGVDESIIYILTFGK